MPEKRGTFVVTQVDEDSAVLTDVADAQVHTMDTNPELAVKEVLDANIATKPPLDVVWQFESIDDRRRIEVSVSEERPTKASREIAEGMTVGNLDRRERTDYGEIHVLKVPPGETETAVADIEADVATVTRAARLGIRRVEIRSAAGIVSVRYLP